jgi:hypothetical protein
MMRTVLIVIAVVLTLGAAFDVLVTLDLMLAERTARTVGEYLAEGAPVLAWAGDILARTLPETVLQPALSLPSDWFFPVRAAALGLCAAVLFALVRAQAR